MLVVLPFLSSPLWLAFLGNVQGVATRQHCRRFNKSVDLTLLSS